MYLSYSKLCSLAVFMTLALAGCNATFATKEPALKEYRLDQPEKLLMPESLLEISGISFRKGKNDTIYAIQDEEGKVFKLVWGLSYQQHVKFARAGDYEDVSIVHDRVIVLKSNGNLYSFPFSETAFGETSTAQIWDHLLPKGEYEAMFGDDSDGRLYVLCKNCKDDDAKNSVSGFILQPGDPATLAGKFSIDVNEIKNISGKVKKGFRPSGLAKNPVTGEWHIISSVNKMMVITDKNWKVINAVQLNGNIFNQPEGIAFDHEGNLYISNEGGKLGQGNILMFKRQQQ